MSGSSVVSDAREKLRKLSILMVTSHNNYFLAKHVLV